MQYNKRINKVQRYLKRNKLDAFLISQPENRRYLSGYSDGDHGISETSGALLIPVKGKPVLMTDFRYELQAKMEALTCEVLLYPKGLLALLEKILPDRGITNLAFESSYTLHSTFERLKKLGKKCDFKLVAKRNIIEKMRTVKDKDEIALIKQSVKLNEMVFQQILPSISPKITEIDLALEIEAVMRKNGASGPSFSSIVASGLNSARPHAVPTTAKIRNNSPITIDMGLILNGYCSDMTRSFSTGKSSKKYKKIHRIVRKAQLAGMEAVAPGVKPSQVDKVARKIIEEAGYGKYFGHALGHGVGLAVHEEPRVSTQSTKKLQPGMVITIEPGIYIPNWGGIRLENMVVVTKDGYENLNNDTTYLDI